MKVVVEIDCGRVGLEAAQDLMHHVADNLCAIMSKGRLDLYCDFGNRDKIGFVEFKMSRPAKHVCVNMAYGADGKWVPIGIDNGRKLLNGDRTAN